VVTNVLNVLWGELMLERWNETTIVLIPKVQCPENIRDLRPISLRNVI
jgi:hypothetical protein